MHSAVSRQARGSAGGYVYYNVPIVIGKADIISYLRDKYRPGPGEDLEFPPITRLGTYNIGYRILDKNGQVLVALDGPQGRTFAGGMPGEQGMMNGATARALYREAGSERFPTTDGNRNDDLYHAVSNFHPALDAGNWTAEATKGCWNTRMVKNGGLPWEAVNATQDADPEKPGYPEFKDGSYFVRVTVNDGFFPDVQAERLAEVDNFAPFLRDAKLYRQCIGRAQDGADIAEGPGAKSKNGGGGTPEERDWSAIYQASWEITEGTELELQVVHREPAAVDEELLVRLEFSECMSSALVLASWDVEGGELVSGDWVDEDQTTWEGTIPAAGQVGLRRLLVHGTDMAGNHLDSTLDHVISREADGSWDHPGYDPSADLADLNHSWPVSPDLWVLERTSDGAQRLAGCDKDGATLMSVSLGGSESSTDRLVCAGDPVQGGCWVYGMELGVRYYDLDGDGHMFFDVDLGSPRAEWIGADHQQFGCWRVEWCDGAVMIQRHCYDEDLGAWVNQPADPLLLRDEAVFCAASMDHSTGTALVCLRPSNATGGQLFRVTPNGGTLAVSSYNIPVAASAPFVYDVGVSAIEDGSNQAWVAAYCEVQEGGGAKARMRLMRFTGSSFSLVYEREAEHESLWPWGWISGSPAVCAFARTGECTSPWIVDQCYDIPDFPRGPRAADDDRFVPCDAALCMDQMVFSTGGSAQFCSPGCRAFCNEVFSDNLMISESPGFDGGWWVHKHMPPQEDSDACIGPDPYPWEDKAFTDDVYFLDPGGAMSLRFSTTSTEWDDPGSYKGLGTCGVMGISAGAGAVCPPNPPATQLVTIKQGPSQVSATAQDAAPKAFTWGLTAVHPNPCTDCGWVAAEYSLAQSAAPVFEIYNVQGQLLSRRWEGSRPGGRYQFLWDLRSRLGLRVPAGSYILQMKTDEYVGRTPLVVIR